MTDQSVTADFPTDHNHWITATHLYVIGVIDRGPVKIGISAEPVIRLRETAYPYRLEILAPEDVVPDLIGEDEKPEVILSPLDSADDEYDGLSFTFAKACREADAKARRKPVDPRIARARRLLDDNVSLERAWDEINAPQGVPLATLRAAEFLIRQKDPARLRAWLAKHSAAECKAILDHLERRRGKNERAHEG